MKALVLACALLAPFPAAAASLPADQLKSPMWEFVSDQVFGQGAAVSFDPRVKVSFPSIAENQRIFPVQVDARGIPDVVRMVIIVDLNPIQLPIDYRLSGAEAFVATRIKLDQRTPVRGAVQLKDGRWLVSGGWIDAAGGGCSAPPASRVKGDWAQHIGEVRGRLWDNADGARLRLSFRHPMDTGFVNNISAYYIDDLKLTAADGRALGEVKMQAAVAEDPALTLMPKVAAGEQVIFAGRDTNGIEYNGTLTPETQVAAVTGTTR